MLHCGVSGLMPQDRAVTIELKKATILCTSKGCSWKGSNKDYHDHIKNCKFTTVSMGCPEEISRSDFKPTKCVHCGREMQDQNMQKEELKPCKEFEEACSQECSSPLSPTEQMMSGDTQGKSELVLGRDSRTPSKISVSSSVLLNLYSSEISEIHKRILLLEDAIIKNADIDHKIVELEKELNKVKTQLPTGSAFHDHF